MKKKLKKEWLKTCIATGKKDDEYDESVRPWEDKGK